MHAKKIVVGVNGSAASNAALEWAVQAAVQTSAEIIAVHVLKPIEGRTSVTSVAEVRLREFGYVGVGVRARVKSEMFAPLTTSAVKHRILILEGQPATEILGVADAEDAALIVVGNGLHSTMEDLFLGRVAHELTHRSRRPLAVIPAAAHATDVDAVGKVQHQSEVLRQTRQHRNGATGEPLREDAVGELISREHALIRRHHNHMRGVADEAQQEVKLCTPGYGRPAGRGA
ncbi:MAG: universal stress protein [Candidatus Dormibacteria bacterium]